MCVCMHIHTCAHKHMCTHINALQTSACKYADNIYKVNYRKYELRIKCGDMYCLHVCTMKHNMFNCVGYLNPPDVDINR